MHRLSKTVAANLLLVSQRCCTQHAVPTNRDPAPTETGGALTAAVSTCIGQRRANQVRCRCRRRRRFSSYSGGNLRRRRPGEISGLSWTRPPLLSRGPRGSRSSAYHTTGSLQALAVGFAQCGVGVTAWATEFCPAAFIRRGRNSRRWWCGGVKGTSAEAREMAAAGLKGSTFFFSDGASTNYCHVTCVIVL